MVSRDFSKFIKDKQVILLVALVVASILCISIFGISQGLDLKGGSLLQLQLDQPVDKATMDIVTTVIDKRLNLYGVKDVKVRSSGEQLVIVEMADVTPDEIARLIGSPGSFEAKIGNVTVLSGSDIESVEMFTLEDTSWHVPFHITPGGAKKFAELAKGKEGEDVGMFLDGKLIDEEPPKLSSELANGVAVSELEVTGGEDTREAAQTKANEVYTVLKT
ncbi:MAG: preprotein translocase subunit SecD, partial [Methanobrevibacter sp.]|nr:preprotein translocase subunit SecD [Methanobrevibacter sp.]